MMALVGRRPNRLLDSEPQPWWLYLWLTVGVSMIITALWSMARYFHNRRGVLDY